MATSSARRRLMLIPYPKEVRWKKGLLRLGDGRRGEIVTAGRADEEQLLRIVRRLKKDMPGVWGRVRADGAMQTPSEGCCLLIVDDESLIPEEGYEMEVTSDGILLKASTYRGMYYAVCTLVQLYRAFPDGSIPCVEVIDAPDVPNRGVYLDMSRGRVPKVDEICRLVELLSTYKINHFQLYVEHTFRFRKHPLIGKGADGLSPEDILRIQQRAAECFVEFTPSIASFGHMQNILSLPPYRHLAEDDGVGRYNPEALKNTSRRVPEQHGWTLSPVVPEVYPFVDELYSEFLPLFASGRVNVCCDETFDLGLGKSYEACKEKGLGRVFAGHVNRIAEIASRYGKGIMLWGDMLLQAKEAMEDLVDDATVLNWEYAAEAPFERTCRFFAEAGRDFWVCPGTSGWNSMFPRVDKACANITGFVRAGMKHRTTGVLNTDWGDGGHYNFHDFSWHGYLYGAERSWNATSDDADFDERFSVQFFGDHSGAVGKAVRKLGNACELEWYERNASFSAYAFFSPLDGEILGQFKAATGKKAMRMAEEAKDVFIRAKRRCDDDYLLRILNEYVYAADTVWMAGWKIVAHRRLSKTSERGTLYREHAKRMKSLQKRFIELWKTHSRVSEMRITLERIRKALDGEG